MNGKTLLGVVLAGVATFMWGFAFWGATTIPYQVWESVPNDAATQAELARMFPKSGYYGIPSMANNSAEESASLLQSGAWAMINIDHNPPLPGDVTTMGLGLIHNIVVMFLLALLIKHLHSNHLRTAILVGLTATVFHNLGDVIWWNYPLNWKGTLMLYDMGFWMVGGLVLSFFMRDSMA